MITVSEHKTLHTASEGGYKPKVGLIACNFNELLLQSLLSVSEGREGGFSPTNRSEKTSPRSVDPGSAMSDPTIAGLSQSGGATFDNGDGAAGACAYGEKR